MTNAQHTSDLNSILRGTAMDVEHGGEFGPYNAPSRAYRSIVLVGWTGDRDDPWGTWHERYVASLPHHLRVATPSPSTPAHVLRLRYWRSGPLQGSTTASLVPALLDPVTGNYTLQQRVAAGGHSARFIDPEARNYIHRITGQHLESVSIHDHDMTTDTQNNVD